MYISRIQATILAFCIGCASHVIAQPINNENYRTHIFDSPWVNPDPPPGPDRMQACYSTVFNKVSWPLGTGNYLAMFSDKFHADPSGRVYTVKNENGDGGFPVQAIHNMKNGIYQVVSNSDSCVWFYLVGEYEDIGQIIHIGYHKDFYPIRIIGVDQKSNKIYGYHETSAFSSLARKATAWGTAKDGSLVKVLTPDGGVAKIIGLHPDGRRISIWGGFEKFSYSRSDDMTCATNPAGFDTWGGKWGEFIGNYCPDKNSNQLVKYLWRPSSKGGPTVTDVVREPARAITRLSHNSNIFGISTYGNLLTLINNDKNILSMPILPSLLKDKSLVAVGGLGDNDDKGIFVVDTEGKLYNVYWDEDSCDANSFSWKAREVPLNLFQPEGELSVFFGSSFANSYLEDQAYVLYGWHEDSSSCTDATFYLYRLDFNTVDDKYEAVLVESDEQVEFCH